MAVLADIKKRVEIELRALGAQFQKPPLSSLPALYRESIRRFILRDGKRVRPVLFALAYKGYSSREPPGLYLTAVSLELIHDFILIHDDIIDHSTTRRGTLSMHVRFGRHLRRRAIRRFRGEDLAMIVGDVLYALALRLFLSVREDPRRKEAALQTLTQAALYTGCGEMEELLLTLKPLARVTRREILRVYDWKTSHYTFRCPLVTGATLAGADEWDLGRLAEIGLCLGRAYQIRDDMIGLRNPDARHGKTALLDLQEGRRTLPAWLAFRRGTADERQRMERVLAGRAPRLGEMTEVARIIRQSGSLHLAEREIKRLQKKADGLIAALSMRKACRARLSRFAAEILDLPPRRLV
jgi:geranylgeranyl diphosphate synthase, type I